MARSNSDIWFWDLPAALVLLTRLPVPPLPDRAFANAARAVWAYPLVGLLLGGLVALLYTALGLVGLPDMLVAGIVLVALVMMTGAMHEDGLADSADGLWGGLDRARRLEIMKDSRIGTYGVLALVLAMGLRWLGYAEVSIAEIVAALVVSRAAMPPLMHALPHARDGGLSKSVGKPTLGPVCAAVIIAAVGLFLLAGPMGGVALIIATLATGAMAWLARTKIGGQTGDILGATQIVVEIAVLLVFATH
ncbi:adenosylcobinamide-GDP ribazoletransferase [Tateyamaria sp. SN6-1]|uniref:adenosylcobinamide-GDP ribazoletransferase n=1 Tax=Tateyamaria sp. SN6-1 TaxID=3092148 RepID=UPI0039F5B182